MAFDIEKKDQFDVSLKRGEQKRVLNLTKRKKGTIQFVQDTVQFRMMQKDHKNGIATVKNIQTCLTYFHTNAKMDGLK